MSATKKQYRLIFLSLFFSVATTRAQYDIDSLKANIENPKLHDTTKLANIALLIDNLFGNTEANTYTDLMGRIAKKNLERKDLSVILRKKYTMYLAAYYNNISVQLEDKGDPKSLDYLNKSIQLYRSVNADDEVYTSLVSKGLLLSNRKRYKEAIDCYFSALKYFEKNPKENADGISYVYTNLGVLYGEQRQDEISIMYLKKAIANINQKRENPTVEDALQKSAIYCNIGIKYATLKRYKEATEYLNASLALSEKHGQNSFRSIALVRLGMIDLHYKRFDAAKSKLLLGRQLAESKQSKAFASIQLGKFYYEVKQYQKAQDLFEEGLAIGKEAGNLDLIEEAYFSLFQINKTTGNFKKGIQMLESYHAIKDSAKIEETKDELKRQQLKYSYEKRELNYKLQAHKKNAAKNNLLIGLASTVLLLLIGAYFFYRNHKHKQAIANFEKNILKQKLLLTQMNPHFIFNSIDNIQTLIYNKQDKEAVEYLSKFSKLTRQILENSSENYIEFSEELAMIDNYLSIQQLLYNNKFVFTITVSEKIDKEKILVPPMLAQPFIENAIKHGLSETESHGKIAINYYLRSDKLIFEITDNGIGFRDVEKVGERKSLAMKIAKERLKSISNKIDFEVQTSNLLDAENRVVGAKVLFEIPYIYEN